MFSDTEKNKFEEEKNYTTHTEILYNTTITMDYLYTVSLYPHSVRTFK